MKDWWLRLTENPVVAHAMRTQSRFSTRLGNQSAAAIAYYSVLSMVPVLMLTFSVVGMTLTVFRPDLLVALQDQITQVLPAEGIGKSVSDIMTNALQNWSTIGLVGLGAGAWSGANWARNLKRAIRVQMREDIDDTENDRMYLIDQVINVGVAAVLIVLLMVTLGLSSAVSSLSSLLADLLQLSGVVNRILLSVSSLGGALIAGFGLFMFLMGALPNRRFPVRDVVRGSAIGSVGMTLLLYLASIIISAFSRNAAAAIFGPVIVLMLFLKMFATLILMVASWIATTHIPADMNDETAQSDSSTLEHETVAQPLDTTPDRAMQRGFRWGTLLTGSIAAAAVLGYSVVKSSVSTRKNEKLAAGPKD